MAAVKVSALILWRGLGFFVAGGPRGARGRDAVLQVESLPLLSAKPCLQCSSSLTSYSLILKTCHAV